MTRFQAHKEATHRWGTAGIGPTDRVGFVIIRRKSSADRFEVGYYVRGGGGLPTSVVTMGKGPSWEEAFAHAERTGAAHRMRGV